MLTLYHLCYNTTVTHMRDAQLPHMPSKSLLLRSPLYPKTMPVPVRFVMLLRSLVTD